MMRRAASFAAPLLLAAIPVVTLLANNIESVAPQYALRPLLLTLGGAGLLVAVCLALLRDRERGLVVASLVALTISTGTIGESIRVAAPGTIAGPLASAVQLLWIGVLLAAIAMTIQRNQPPKDLGLILFAVSLPMLILPAVTLLRHEIDLSRPNPGGSELSGPAYTPFESLPDVYYLVLDGYGREDVLTDMYRADNREFIGRLKALGFYVANDSRANYSQTSLSLASSLNMSYLDEVAAELGVDNRDQRPLNRLIRHNEVRRAFEDLGYEVDAFQTGYRKTEWEDADHFFAPTTNAASAFEVLYTDVLGLTPITRWLVSRGWLDEMPGYAAHRNRIRFAFEQAAALDASARPRLVFLHVILPHPPFVFGADGSAARSIEPFEIEDGTEFSGTPAEYIAGYSAQLEFANEQALELVEQVLRRSARPVVILIQGDHGPGSQLDWDVPERSNLRERMGILNAYYAPKAEAGLYPSITPVNSFRLVLNHYLGYNLALLPDRSYLSSWRAPYRFIEYREE